MKLTPLILSLAAALAASTVQADPLDHGDLVTFPTRAGVTQSLFVESPSPTPPWVIVLFPGVPGALHLDASGATTLKGNFVVRSAHHWINWGDAVALVDTPSNKSGGVDDLFRLTKESFTDTQAVVATLRQRFPGAKIALVGTSSGTVSVGNALQRDPAMADAFVLTSPVTVSRRGGDTLAGLDVDGTKYRVLVVSNQGDECPASPAYAARRLADHNHFGFVQVDSTGGRGNPSTQCGGHSPHGFLGIEPEVLGDIHGWLDGQPPQAK
ncbi:alpha/beta hydrolase [Burkholderia sp. WAC0059]|uniref:alpha/beta hydrolase n=1 Tax=Burkholderia sp. WAC0059 TaxID=2066022 RepID=UPI0011AF1971|nr:alpha/beta hydrolase [Burkholderia sp. WAC0059]